MPSISNSLSCVPISLSNSSEYESPEHPPPFTPILKKTFAGSFWSRWSSLPCWPPPSVTSTAITRSPPRSSRGGRRGGARLQPLLFAVRQRRLDRVLGEHRAVDLDGRQLQLIHDVGVLDLGRLVNRLALQPLGGQARRRDRAATPERLELRVLDDSGLEVHLDLQLHHVAALGRADEARAHARCVLREGPDVARVVVVIDDLLAVRHDPTPPLLGLPPDGFQVHAFFRQLVERRHLPEPLHHLDRPLGHELH